MKYISAFGISVALACALWLPVSVSALTCASQTVADTDMGLNDEADAQSFIPPADCALDSVQLNFMSITGSPTTNTVDVVDDNSGSPGSTVIDTCTGSAPSVGLNTYTCTGGVVHSGVQYWVEAVFGASDYPRVYGHAGGSLPTNFAYKAGGTWYLDGSRQWYLVITGHTPGGGSVASSTAFDEVFGSATTSATNQTLTVVDIPNLDFFLGVFLMYLIAWGVVWFFRSRRPL